MPAADDAFVPFAQLLRPAPEAVAPAPEPSAANAPPATDPPGPLGADVARDLRLARARLADAFDAAGDPALGKAARATLGRQIDAALAALLERIG